MVEELTFEDFEGRAKTETTPNGRTIPFPSCRRRRPFLVTAAAWTAAIITAGAVLETSSKESRKTYRRDLFDRRGMQFVCKTSAPCSEALAYLEKFGRHWNLTGLDRLDVRASVLDESRWCLDWSLNVDHVFVSWRSAASRLPDSATFTLQPLGGDLDVFDGRVWVTPLPHGSQIHFNLIAAFGLGSFERLVGNIFRLRCEKVFRALLLKWKNDLDHLS